MMQGYPVSDKKSTPISQQGNCGHDSTDDSRVVAPPKKDPRQKAAVGERIRKTREARGMQQVELAKAAGVKPHTMWRYEAGQTAPGNDKMDRIAEALGVPQRWLNRGGPTPPGLSFDDEPRKRIVKDPPLTQEQQIEVLDELDASPQLRVCWALHRQGTGAYQRITRVYMASFLEVAQLELDAGEDQDTAVTRAGEYAFNAAVEAHRASAGPAKPAPHAKARSKQSRELKR